MTVRSSLTWVAGIGLLVGLAVVARPHDHWLPWLSPAKPTSQAESGPPAQGKGEAQQVKLTPQARSNLRLTAKPLQVDTFWRTVQMPGMIIDRPAYSDRGIVAPVTGVVTKVHHFPGDTVQPGETLFTLRLLSEASHLTQSELFKTTQEIHITQEQKKRLTEPGLVGAIAENRTIELDNKLRLLKVAVQACRQELLMRGLTPAQIDGVTEGKYVAVVEVKAPQPGNADKKSWPGLVGPFPSGSPDALHGPLFEVQELKVELGQQVVAGQTLGLLSNHQSLYIEGRGFRPEMPLVEKAAKEAWPVQVEFMEEKDRWPPLAQTFAIRHIANTIDPASQTFAFYLPLSNQSRTYEKDRTRILWRFRPGQKIRLHLHVEKFDNVFVLPGEAVVREGPEAYVFRQNGDLFDRKSVRVVYQDRQHVVIANDGSIPPGLFVAQNGAMQLNRVLKAQGGQTSGFHVHADGSIHANH